MGIFTRPRTPVPRAPRLLSPPPHTTLPYSAHRSMTAAAKTVNLQNPDEIARLARRRGGDAWQSEAWEYYDAIGEVKYALGLVASVLSRIRLYAAYVDDPSQPPSPVDPDTPAGGAAIAALSKLDSAFGGQPGLLRDAALNLAVAGECYLVQRPAHGFPSRPESWDIRSVDELTVNASGESTITTRRDGDASSRFRLPSNAFVARIWRPHPRYSDEADSSLKGILDQCAELLLLNRTFRATARSRLNAGMLYLPDGMGVAATPDPDLLDDEPDDTQDFSSLASPEEDMDDFENSLVEAMSTPIADEDSASAVVPLLVRGPAELADKIKLIKFERSFDPALAVRADRVLDRIMQGIDVPKDVVSGLANVKYSNAVQIDDSLFKSHIEPLTLLLCDALTVVYLRQALLSKGIDPDEARRYVVWYDPSEVTTRPNQADDADTGYTNHTLSGAAWRRAHGFTDDDAPDPTELAVRLLTEHPTVTPELTESLLSVIAPEVMQRVRAASQANNPAPLPTDVTNALGAPAPASAPAPPQDQPVAAPETPAPAPASPNGAPVQDIPASQLL